MEVEVGNKRLEVGGGSTKNHSKIYSLMLAYKCFRYIQDKNHLKCLKQVVIICNIHLECESQVLIKSIYIICTY